MSFQSDGGVSEYKITTHKQMSYQSDYDMSEYKNITYNCHLNFRVVRVSFYPSIRQAEKRITYWNYAFPFKWSLDVRLRLESFLTES